MTRKRPIIYLRSKFLLRVENTPIYNKEQGILDLEKRKGIGGIGFSVNKISEDTFEIKSRTSLINYAILDYSYLERTLKRNYGIIVEKGLEGKYIKGKQITWIQYIHDINKIKPKNEYDEIYYPTWRIDNYWRIIQ